MTAAGATPGGSARAADVEWVRQKGVHRILDALARDVILHRPADVLLHIIEWAQTRLSDGGKSAASPPEPPVIGVETFAKPATLDVPAQAPPQEPGAVDKSGLRTPERSPTAGSVSRRSVADMAHRRESHPGRSGGSQGRGDSHRPSAAAADAAAADAGDGDEADELPEIDDLPHRHKWDPDAPVDWRPSPEQLRERYPDPKGELRFLSEIDAGHYGRVYECARRSGGARLAVKKVPIEGDWVELEVANLRHCACEWVVRLEDAWYCEEEDRLWIAMERLGHSLAAVADAAGERAFAEPVVAESCRQILSGLEAIHAVQRVHLDVKPGNLLVGGDGRLRLADFGTMMVVGDKCEQLGDFAFMAPEVAYSVGDYTGQSDVWSAAITCLYLADGEAPLATEKPELLMRIHKDTCMVPSLWEPQKWSAEFSGFLSRCFRKAAAERPTAADCLRDPWVVGQAQQPLQLPPPLGPVAHLSGRPATSGHTRHS